MRNIGGETFGEFEFKSKDTELLVGKILANGQMSLFANIFPTT